ncbi:hypothetical protein BGZ79_001924 [Entomortierella chlamydospora]|nr:hypothetical protein BGZ79_001924 [Entomortierella chlamydospora]
MDAVERSGSIVESLDCNGLDGSSCFIAGSPECDGAVEYSCFIDDDPACGGGPRYSCFIDRDIDCDIAAVGFCFIGESSESSDDIGRPRFAGEGFGSNDEIGYSCFIGEDPRCDVVKCSCFIDDDAECDVVACSCFIDWSPEPKNAVAVSRLIEVDSVFGNTVGYLCFVGDTGDNLELDDARPGNLENDGDDIGIGALGGDIGEADFIVDDPDGDGDDFGSGDSAGSIDTEWVGTDGISGTDAFDRDRGALGTAVFARRGATFFFVGVGGVSSVGMFSDTESDTDNLGNTGLDDEDEGDADARLNTRDGDDTRLNAEDDADAGLSVGDDNGGNIDVGAGSDSADPDWASCLRFLGSLPRRPPVSFRPVDMALFLMRSSRSLSICSRSNSSSGDVTSGNIGETFRGGGVLGSGVR